MAFTDYGAIVLKNKKLISTELFEDMKKCVGWVDNSVDGDYFAFVGNEKITLAFYKEQITIFIDKQKQETEYFGFSYFKWKTYKRSFFPDAKMIVKKRKNCFVCDFIINKEVYKIYFGYGVDLDLYKKFRVINAYKGIGKFLYKFL
jgi:hypothetical protein